MDLIIAKSFSLYLRTTYKKAYLTERRVELYEVALLLAVLRHLVAARHSDDGAVVVPLR